MPIVTETVALTKWCAPLSQQTRLLDWDFAGSSAPATVGRRPRCIGSLCMLWQWKSELHTTSADKGYCAFSNFVTSNFVAGADPGASRSSARNPAGNDLTR